MMMTDHPESPPPPGLDAGTVEAVRDALARYVRSGDHTPELRATLLRVAAEAREKGIFAERLLVMLKEIWGGLPEVRQADRSQIGAQRALLQQFVTRCIEEYYTR